MPRPRSRGRVLTPARRRQRDRAAARDVRHRPRRARPAHLGRGGTQRLTIGKPALSRSPLGVAAKSRVPCNSRLGRRIRLSRSTLLLPPASGKPRHGVAHCLFPAGVALRGGLSFLATSLGVTVAGRGRPVPRGSGSALPCLHRRHQRSTADGVSWAIDPPVDWRPRGERGSWPSAHIAASAIRGSAVGRSKSR
jgi:hypothetical protein